MTDTQPRGIGDAVFVIGAPRSGTTVFQRVLSLHEALWGPFGESHHVLEGPFRPDLRAGDSNRVGAERLTPAIAAALHDGFWRSAINVPAAFPDDAALAQTEGIAARLALRARARVAATRQASRRPHRLHLLEKTPKNALRVPMLAALVPSARFLLLVRDGARTIDSLISGWRAVDRVGPLRRKRFRTYRLDPAFRLADYDEPWWNFVLVPGWRALAGRSVADVAVAQYRACSLVAAEDLAALDPSRRRIVRYEALTRAPVEVMADVLAWLGLPVTDRVQGFARRFVRAPERSLRHETEIRARAGDWSDVEARVRALLPGV